MLDAWELDRLLKHALVQMKKYIFSMIREVMINVVVDVIQGEFVAYIGMILILTAFFLETRGILKSKEIAYLGLMAAGSGLLAVRAYFIDEWAFLILEIAWFLAAIWGAWDFYEKRSGLQAVIFPVKALAITVSGLKYNFPGPIFPESSC